MHTSYAGVPGAATAQGSYYVPGNSVKTVSYAGGGSRKGDGLRSTVVCLRQATVGLVECEKQRPRGWEKVAARPFERVGYGGTGADIFSARTLMNANL